MAKNKKINIIKSKKLRWIRKKKLISYYMSSTDFMEESYNKILESNQKLWKTIENPVGTIKANLLLEREKINWHMVISVEEEIHVDMHGHLGMILLMLNHFKKIYDLIELRTVTKKKEGDKNENI